MHPERPDELWLGSERRVLRSLDGGQTATHLDPDVGPAPRAGEVRLGPVTGLLVPASGPTLVGTEGWGVLLVSP